MSYVTMKQMLETGVHFGHQTRRWNPKMRPFIFGARNGIHIIDLQQTVKLYRDAHDFIADTVAKGGDVIFVGTKRQAQESVKAEAERCGMHFITNRWLGGTLTNFQTISRSIDRLKKIEAMYEDGTINRYTKKEQSRFSRELEKLNENLGGIKHLQDLPRVAFIIDPKREDIAVKECRKLGIPIAAVVDTNCDPDLIDFVIPGNDDAIRAIKLFVTHIAEAALEGKARRDDTKAMEKEMAAPQEAKAPKASRPAPKAEAAPAPKAEAAPAPKAEAAPAPETAPATKPQDAPEPESKAEEAPAAEKPATDETAEEE